MRVYVRPRLRCAVVSTLVLALAIGALLYGSQPAKSQSASEPIIIAGDLALTGPAGAVGVELQRGAQLAIDEINAAGGVLGRKLKFEAQDTTGAPAQAVQVFNSFAQNPNVMVIFGPVNAPEVGAVSNLAASKKLVVFAPASAGAVPGIPDLKFNDWTFRLNQAQPTVMGPLITKVIDLTKAKSVTILNYSDNSAYVTVGDLWQKAASDAGTTVQRIQFPTATQDYSAIVTEIHKPVDLVAIGALSATDGALVRAIRQSGFTGPIVGDASMIASAVYTVSQGGTKGAYAYSSYMVGEGAGTAEFVDAYKKVYGTDPSAIVAYGYETIKLVANALTFEKSVSRQSLRDGLGAIKDYRGITGTVTYHNSGDAVRQTVPLVQITDGGGLKKIGDITVK
jgi:branched-chain amino acid transport system substrate-binding protein